MSDFDLLWKEHIMVLQGGEIPTATGKLNKISLVTDSYLERISSQGKKSKIEKSFFKNAYNDLLTKRALTRAEINSKYGKRCSSIVTAVLAKLPNVILKNSPVELKMAS